MQTILACSAAALLPSTVYGSSGRPGYGLIGYGIYMYKPPCAYTCASSISYPLKCNDTAAHDHMVKRMMGMDMEEPSPECYATNDAYLQTLAYCISTHCEGVELWKLERFWMMNVAGRKLPKNQPTPKMSYQEALESITQVPTEIAPAEEMLEGPTLVDEEAYLANYNGNAGFELNEGRHSRYSLVLLLACTIVPIALSCLRWLPIPGRIVSRFSATFIDPPLLGPHHQVPLLNAAHVPTRGQGLFIGYLLLINIILSAVGFEITWPNSWYATRPSEIANYVANRTGALSAVNFSLLVLYAGRNNFLLWLTNWSQSTFLLLHKWIAAIATIQACLHSAMYLQSYVEVSKEYSTEHKTDYWIWGVVSTMSMVILLPISTYWFRKRLYELFLAVHIVLAFFALLGYYYHIYLRFKRQWGYELWAYIAFALWAFERVARVLRVGRNGVLTGRVTVIDEDYVRLDVPGCSATGQAYLYYPTLTWRVWENHPFSVAGSLFTEAPHSTSSGVAATDSEKTPAQNVAAVDSDSGSDIARNPFAPAQKTLKAGLTFFIRTHTGLTRQLRSRKAVPVLVESSYGKSLLHDQHAELDKSPTLVCITGGVGITAILPLLAKHAGNRRLYWGVRNRGLVEAAQDMLDAPALAGVQRHITIGERLDLQSVLQQEIGRADKSEEKIAVVVSGPAGMADEVRNTVSRLARAAKTAEVIFVEESYTW